MNKYTNIPTNIISGFLGAGKTTSIMQLLKQRPGSERWAVIVNEFGKIGIDGSLLKTEGVAIKEIPGGCLCCVGSQLLNVGLNQIVRKIKPHRILIEPTGLGHPAALIDTLSGEFYKTVLDLKAVINLVDARQLTDDRYTQHQIYRDQIKHADVLVANKIDTYTEDDKQHFYDLSMSCVPAKEKVFMVKQGELLLDWLNFSHKVKNETLNPDLHHHHAPNEVATENQNEANWLMVEGHNDGFMSLGWNIKPSTVLDKTALADWLSLIFEQMGVERVKGIVQTDKGWISINNTPTEQQISQHDGHLYTMLEVIASELLDAEELNRQLKKLRIHN